MDSELLERTLNFHGNDLLRSMAKYCGMDILTIVDPRQVTYFDFHKRFKDPKLEDEAKRYKILEFISRKAHMLFKKPKQRTSMMLLDLDDDDNYAVMPPLEAFMGVPEKERHKHYLECLRKGDVVIGVIHAKQAIGFILKLLCVDAGSIREIYDLDIKALCPINQAVAISAHESPVDTYQIKDLIRCVVLEVVPEEEKIIVSMKSDCNPTHATMKLGLISEENLPSNFRKTTKLHGAMYETVLEQSAGFMNPSNVQYICDIMGLTKDGPSLMSGLHEKEYDKEEYAISLRKTQAAKWALQSVADGISHFKAGRHTEAFQCLNKALQIDPENVEALVARGALFANNCNFTRALEDFELAIEINPKHHNARKYMVETLVALGRQHEDKNDNKMAYKLFYKALQFNPDHKEANEAIRSLEVKEKANIKSKQALQTAEVKSSSANVKKEANEPSSSNTREKLKQLLKTERKEKKTKLRDYSSSSSSTSTSSSSGSSSGSSFTGPKSKKRSPEKIERKVIPKTYKLNTRDERSVKYRDDNEKYSAKKSENLIDFGEKMYKDKGKDIPDHSMNTLTSETTVSSGLAFEELAARLNSYYEKFDTTILETKDDKRNAKPMSRFSRKSEEQDLRGKCPSPKVTFVMKADQMDTIGKKYLGKLPTKQEEPEDPQSEDASKGTGSSMWVNNFKPLKLEERKTVVPINVFSSLEKQEKAEMSDVKKVIDKKPGNKSLFLPPTSGKYQASRPHKYKSRSRSRSRSRSYSRSRRSNSKTPRAYRRSRSSSRSRRRSYSRSSSRSRRTRSYSHSRSRSRSRSYSSRSSSRSHHSKNRRSYRSRSRSHSRSRSDDKYYSRSKHSHHDEHHFSRRPFRSRGSSNRSRPFIRGGLDSGVRGRGRGTFHSRPFNPNRSRGRGMRRRGSSSSSSSMPGIVTRAVVPYYKGEMGSVDDELARAATPERSDNAKSDENKTFRSVEEVENLLKQHKAQKKAESLAKNKDIKKSSVW